MDLRLVLLAFNSSIAARRLKIVAGVKDRNAVRTARAQSRHQSKTSTDSRVN